MSQPPYQQYPGQNPGQHPGPYPGQYPGQYPAQYPGQLPGQYPPVPQKRPRPSAWWWLLPGGFFLAAIVVVSLVLVPAFAPAVRSILRTDAAVPLDGRQYTVTLSDTDDRFLWIPDSAPDAGCRVLDADSHRRIPLRVPDTTSTRSRHGVDEHAGFVFSPRTERLLVTCGRPGGGSRSGARVEIGPAIGIGGFARIGFSLMATIALGGFGAVLTLVMIILFATRGPRRPTTA